MLLLTNNVGDPQKLIDMKFSIYSYIKMKYFALKKVNFSETIAANDLQIGTCIQLFEEMKVCAYSRSRSFHDLGPRPFTNEI